MAKAMKPEERRPDARIKDALDRRAVRRVLVEQHARLRELLRALDAKAVAVIRPPCAGAAELRAGLDEAVRTLTEHIEGEERVIAELLPRTRASERALEALREDHGRQCDELEAMRRCGATSDDAISVALAVRAFVADVLLDMDVEDRRYLLAAGPRSVRT
jgi:hypothetical protein